jgi:hypothetical protein
MKCDWIFLSKKGKDEYVNMFAKGCGGKVTNSERFRYEISDRPIVLRSILKYKIMQRCWEDKRDFYYIDTGYFGNRVWKRWHRIVKNDLQHSDIVNRPDDRWRRMRIDLQPRRYGTKILVAAPGDKPCKFYGIDQKEWVENTVVEIKKHTDMPVIVRQKNMSRSDRMANDPLHKVLADDVHALVTFNSNSAVESILNGVPAFVLAKTHAASPVASKDLSTIENPCWPDNDLLQSWCHHLAYGQFHNYEIADGTAYRILNEN